MNCKHCGSTDIRRHVKTIVDEFDDNFEYEVTYVACASCGEHADFDEWLAGLGVIYEADTDSQ